MKRTLTNKQFAEQDEQFKKDCEKANVPPTKRQASKYRNEKGQAYRQRNK